MHVQGGGSVPYINAELLQSLYIASGNKDLVDILMDSTIAQSPEQALLILYSMGIPILPKPSGEGEYTWAVNTAAIGATVESKFAEIGSEMWDRYAEYLDQQKERIVEYLRSPQCREKLEQQSPAYLAYVERNTPIDTQSQARNATGYQEWLSSLPVGMRDQEIHRIQNHIDNSVRLWTNVIEGTSHFVSNHRDESAKDVAFMVASYVITAAFIGDYTNIVDIASNHLVGVNPIQEAAVSVLPLIPEIVQQQATLVINFFAVGLMTFANAEAIGASLKGGQPAATRDTVLAFARNVIEKVQGEQVNYFLMALLVSHVEKGEVTPEKLKEVVKMVKAAMIAIALAALYKFETGSISGHEFKDLLEGKLMPRSEEEKQLVGLLQGLYGKEMMEGNGSQTEWKGVLESLIAFILSKPSVEDLIHPTTVWTRLGEHLYNPEQRG